MKKIIGALLIFCILFMAGCKKNEPAIVITKNMLVYSNDEKTFQAVKGLYGAVLQALTAEVTLLEGAHNEVLEYEYPEDYFLKDDYILTVFEPFAINSFKLTDSFDEQLDDAGAKLIYEAESGGREVQYAYEDGVFTLRFLHESATDIYTVECGKSYDSFTFRHSTLSSGGESIVEFLDFVTVGENNYAIESGKQRCYIEFDADGRIEYFRFSSLSEGENPAGDSIINSPVSAGKNWVTKNKSGVYDSIVEFKDGVLYHSDSSTGTLKEYEIQEAQFNSVFL